MLFKAFQKLMVPAPSFVQVISTVNCREDFIRTIHERGVDAVAYEGYEENSVLSDYLSGLSVNDISRLCPVFGEVSITKGVVNCITAEDEKTLPSLLESGIIDLARLYHHASKEGDIRFTLSDIRSCTKNENFHHHNQIFMTYPFINIGTEWPEGRVSEKTPLIFKPGFKHRSPYVGREEARLVCTFFPKMG